MPWSGPVQQKSNFKKLDKYISNWVFQNKYAMYIKKMTLKKPWANRLMPRAGPLQPTRPPGSIVVGGMWTSPYKNLNASPTIGDHATQNLLVTPPAAPPPPCRNILLTTLVSRSTSKSTRDPVYIYLHLLQVDTLQILSSLSLPLETWTTYNETIWYGKTGVGL